MTARSIQQVLALLRRTHRLAATMNRTVGEQA